MKKRILMIILILCLCLTGCNFVKEPINNYCNDGEHEESEWMTITEATCTIDGLEGIVCNKCGKVLQSEIIKATGHVEVVDEAVEADCEHSGLTEGKHCSKCNEVLVAQQEIKPAHNYEIIEKKDATKTEEGYVKYKCTKCQNEYTQTIEKLSEYDATKETTIVLIDNGSMVSNNNGGVSVEGNTITITKGGDYILNGVLTEGNIVVKAGEEDKVKLSLEGVTLSCSTTDPIYIETGDKVNISAKASSTNTINDNREYDSEGTGAAIYSCIDMDIQGKGRLVINAKYNNGLATKKDLSIKNCTLDVTAPNNAIKGNDSLTIESGIITAISTLGDALKTTDSDVSSKGNQRGTITILDGTIKLYSACDGIDSSYNVEINGGKINIYTESNSEYSEEVTVTSGSSQYVSVSRRVNISSNYKLSAYYTLSDGSTKWVNGTYKSSGMEGYYELDKPSTAKYVKYYIYTSTQTQGQSDSFKYASDQLTINTTCDCYSISSVSGTRISGQWTNLQTGSRNPGGFGPGGGGFNPGGGGNDGNKNKSDYSCKGIKAANEIKITAGLIYIEAHDDALHANNTETIEATSSNGLGNITISGGDITLASDDDGIHADNILTISGGSIVITESYEGLEGNTIDIKDGTIQIASSDDGINAISALKISGGLTYLNANGDGIDSNNSITMTGGIVLATGPTNGGNGVIDFDRTFSFSGGLLLAIGCSGMNQKPTATTGNTSQSKTISTNTSSYVNVVVNSEVIATIKVVKSSQNYCVLAYNNTTYPNASVTVTTSNSNELVNNLYYVK